MEGEVLMSQEELRRARLLEHAVEGKTSLREVAVARRRRPRALTARLPAG